MKNKWRIIGISLLVCGIGIAGYKAAQVLATLPPAHLQQAAQLLQTSRQFLALYGPWVHLIVHGAMYLYLIWCWPRLISWVDLRRKARGHAPLSALGQRHLAISVIAVIGIYELLLWSRHLG